MKKAEDEQIKRDNQSGSHYIQQGKVFIHNNSEFCLLCSGYLGNLRKQSHRNFIIKLLHILTQPCLLACQLLLMNVSIEKLWFFRDNLYAVHSIYT